MPGELLDAKELIDRREYRVAVRRLEQARSKAFAEENTDQLRQLLDLAENIYEQAQGKPREAAGRLVYSVQQNIRLLSRRTALAAGEAWADPFEPEKGHWAEATAPSPDSALSFPLGKPSFLGLIASVLLSLAVLPVCFGVLILFYALAHGKSGSDRTVYELLGIAVVASAAALIYCVMSWVKARRVEKD